MAEITNKLPLRLEGNLIIDVNGRRLCALFDWYEEDGVEKSIPKEQVQKVGEWIVETLNTEDSRRRPIDGPSAAQNSSRGINSGVFFCEER